VGSVKIPYYVTRQHPGRARWGYWAPCLKRRNPKTGKIEPSMMAKLGFKLVDCGIDGPLAWATAESWNRKWRAALAAHRAGVPVGEVERVYPPGSLGEAFGRFKQTATWLDGKKERTREDWERGWKLIEPVFGDINPREVAMEDVDLWYGGDPNNPEVQGLLQTVGVREAHRAMKIWRALWRVAGTLKAANGEKYCERDGDPSLGIRRKTPTARSCIWFEGEAVRLVKRAIRMRYHGLAAALAVAWDSMLSPVDVVSLSQAKLTSDAVGPLFELDRTKSGKAAIATLSRRAARVFAGYVTSLPFTLHPDTPYFHTRGGEPGPKGGRPRPPVPYTVDKLGKDFAKVRAVEFPGDWRQVQDFRRSGAVEAKAGSVDLAALGDKMANSIDSSKFLQSTYLPPASTVVRMADAARGRGRALMRGSDRKGK
jgi:hypothetical protein